MIEFLTDIPGYILPFLFVFTMVVFFHELGHFVVARWCGVHVETFSIGMGREIFGRTDRHGTRWKLAWLPLGGYIKMLGEEDEMLGSLIDREGQDQAREGKKDSFNKKNVYARMAISSAGPIANFLLAIVVFWAIFAAMGIQEETSRIDKIMPGSAAEEAGFQTGDVIHSIDGNEVNNFFDVRRIIAISDGVELAFDVDRGGASKRIYATPRLEEIKDRFGNSQRVGMLGISKLPDQEMKVRSLSVIEALGAGIERTIFISGATLSYLGQIITGSKDVSNLGGPLRIAQFSSQLAGDGLVALLGLAAVLSISLGILNLLPIPVLDGGHIAFYLIEAVKGSPLSERIQEYSMRVGILILFAVMIFVTINDIFHLGVFSSSGSG